MTTIKVDKITPGSGTTTTLGDSGDTFTIPAGVTLNNLGSTNLGDALTYCSTTKSASFTAVANKGYFINTSDASPFLNYAVTVASGSLYVVGGTGNAFYLDGSRTMAITLLKGRTYRFTQTDNTNDGHPLIISTSNSSTLGTMQAGIVSSGVSYYLDGASTQSAYINTTSFNAATTRYIEFQPPATGTYYFACYIHGIQMGGAITSQELTVTLPSSPTIGTEMIIIDSTGNASTNNIVIGRGGSKIKGACVDPKLKTDRVGVRLIYSDASQGWVTVTSANETAPTLNTTPDYIVATGGTITTSGDYRIHTFTGDGSFAVTTAPTPGNNNVSYIVVAGGGAGGKGGGRSAGGGGAGGFREGTLSSDPYSPNKSPLASTPLSVSACTSYPITVGGGGAGTANYAANGSQGSNSIFSTITSTGGGYGGNQNLVPSTGIKNGGPGGSGGGAGGGDQFGTVGSGNTPPVSPPQGNNGGTATGNNGVQNAGGGGGGATSVGVNAATSDAGEGGNGAGTAINPAVGTPGPSGSLKYFAGGGGGGKADGTGNGAGGYGGGGDGSPGPSPTGTAGEAGTANTGGGAGGNSGPGPSSSQSGGSGIVIIRYKYQ